jgi:hypothetical protein
MLKVKQTTKTFTFKVPSGTETVAVRTYVAAADGTHYPHDREVEVPRYEPKTASYVCGPHLDLKVEDVTEQWALAREAPGTLCEHTGEVVVYTEVPE